MSRHTRSATTPSNQANMDEEATKFILHLQQALSDGDTVKILRKALEPTELINNLKELSKKVEAMEEKLDMKDQRIKLLEKKIKTMENNQDAQEQYSRRECLRLNGLGEEKTENIVEEVIKVFNNTMAVQPPIRPEDIARVHRVGKPIDKKKPRQVMIKMTSYRKREDIFKNKKSLINSPLSLNEDLTQIRARLLYRAREARRGGLITSTWSSDGRIVVKLLNNTIKSATTSEELDSIIGPSPTTTTSS